MSYCHMSFDWCSEAIANAVGGECISYVGGNLFLCLLIQASNCCCDRGLLKYSLAHIQQLMRVEWSRVLFEFRRPEIPRQQ